MWDYRSYVRTVLLATIAAALVVLSGCSASDVAAPDAASASTQSSPSTPAAGQEQDEAPGDSAAAAEQRFPDVIAAQVSSASNGTYNVSVTMSSPYDTPQRYADGWRVLAPDGTELGTHQLGHDHASEQPFTRTQTGLAIPPDVGEVTVEGRDQMYGYGGGTLTVPVP